MCGCLEIWSSAVFYNFNFKACAHARNQQAVSQMIKLLVTCVFGDLTLISSPIKIRPENSVKNTDLINIVGLTNLYQSWVMGPDRLYCGK